MSKADKIFVDMCQDILDNGFESEVRPKWEDGTPAHTIKQFGVVNRYDLSEEFPALTLRPTPIKLATDEMLWIWQKKSNNIKDLKSHVWDEWADENGSIGKAYGYQQSLRHMYKNVNYEGLAAAFPGITRNINSYIYKSEQGVFEIASFFGNNGFMTQLDKALYDLKNNPYSRRIIVSMWNPSDLYQMNLEPCAYSITFNVKDDVLNAILNQRSQDILAAGNWNVVQYAMLLKMVAQVSGLKAGELVHVIADAHIYDRHVDIIKELITRPQYPAPTVTLDPDVKNFYDFSLDSIKVENYQHGEQVRDIPVAV